MKIKKSQLKQIIKEELDTVLKEDFKARAAALDAEREYDKVKVSYGAARDDLLEIAEALKLVIDVTEMAKTKGTEMFPRPGSLYPTPYGLETTDQASLKTLLEMVNEGAELLDRGAAAPTPPQVPPVNELNNRSTSLSVANKRVKQVLNEMDELEVEKIDPMLTKPVMAFDFYMDKNYNKSWGTRPVLEQHAYYIHDAIRTLQHPVPEELRDVLYRYSKKGFLAGMWGSDKIKSY